jgi:hypothetical protein
MPPALFGLFIFRLGPHIFASASLDPDPSIYASYVVGMTDVPPCPAFLLVEMGSLKVWGELELCDPSDLYLLSS